MHGLIPKAYDVSRLMVSGAVNTDLVELVTSVIQPEEWDRVAAAHDPRSGEEASAGVA